MKILILGGAGMLGHKLLQKLSPEADVFVTVRDDGRFLVEHGLASAQQIIPGLDITNDFNLRKTINDLRPDAVINSVGVIKQLPPANDVVTTLLVNSILPHKLRDLSNEFGFRFVQISTDCVFLGSKGNYSEHDPADALDLYGRSKSLGEIADGNCVTVRSSMIGRELSTSHSLIEWFLSNRGKRIKGYANAIYSGFPTIVFADIIRSLLFEHRQLRGLYHISSDPIDKYSLLVLANQAYGANVTIEPDESFRLDRSLDSSKFRELTGFVPMSWEEMVEQMANDPTPYEEWRK